MRAQAFEFREFFHRVQAASAKATETRKPSGPKSMGNPPAVPGDSRSLTAPGVVCEAVFREPLKVYERSRPCKRMKV